MKNAENPAAATAQPRSPQPFPGKLFVETTSRCNLGCLMCVRHSPGGEATEGDLSAKMFSALEPAFPHLEALVLNGIGEPLLHPQLEKFIQTAKEAMPVKGWIGFQTNGLLLDERRAITLVRAGLDRICISVDGASEEVFRSVRSGGELPAVVRAFDALAIARKECRRSLDVGMEFVLMRSNMGELPGALRWGAEHGATFAIVTHLLPYDEQHMGETLYDLCSEESVKLFNSYRAQARALGLELGDYFAARWKFARGPREEKIVAMVDAMKNEAESRGIFIDLKKLIAIESKRLGQVAELFAEAREVAVETGLDLRLPELMPSENRRCAFVEEGSAFVNWQGDVSPCYFLWHRYLCFASGWAQKVLPRVFGNLGSEGIVEIWNDPQFSSFRQNVLAYDYPVCSGCTLAPCDYVQTDEFQQDCHIGGVPCGACLWCMGVFQCLH